MAGEKETKDQLLKLESELQTENEKAIELQEKIGELGKQIIEPNSGSETIQFGSGKPHISPMVKFEVKYPENFQGKKYMSEGVREVSKETARQFEEKGIGKILNN